ncbi:outer membrane-specific lipoprotein transporter subunit LolC [Ruminiclostridium hungatei]|uniref:Outer membrane-specific lipoprotein transporter subunit LolC n=1 Tax=Ruminiclostridium hungatei TaxID=48256 RepID=A0A1V4SMH7_RUMHU|nr:ABC transporter permease [Ruminiclostridium hungatei]OPX44431.1 outer membrane-specific lipoprotein transporter subunit LolC [Ruminiclostridium hungatei]
MLLKKMLRDMKNHKTQFISIFLMAFLGVFVYSGIGGEWYGLYKTSSGYYEDTNLADVWIYGNNFSKEDAASVSRVAGVRQVQRRLSLDAVADFDNSPSIKLHIIEDNSVSKFLPVSGENFSSASDGIWLDDLFARAKHLKSGDSITLSVLGKKLQKKILGTILSPEYVFATGANDIVPNHNNFGFAYLSAAALPKGINIPFTDLLVKTDSLSAPSLESSIDNALKGRYSVYLNRDDFLSYSMFSDEIQQHKAMGSVFPAVFLSIALLTILTTMTRLVNSQRTQLGTLKALGFRNKAILFHYIAYGFWLSLAGTVLGVILGPLALPRLFYGAMKTTYTLPEWKPAIPPEIFIMALLTVLMCCLTTYLACRSNLKDTPSQALRPKAPKEMKQRARDYTPVWTRLGFNLQWNLRDMARNKVRSVMAVAGALGCSALLVCAFGMQDSLDDVVQWQYKDLNRFSTKLSLAENISRDTLDSVLSQTDGEALMEGAVEIKANGRRKPGELLVTDKVSLIKYTDPGRNYMELPSDMISISYKMSRLLGVKQGDTVSWHVYGQEKWITGKIGAVYRSPVSQGITLTREMYEKLGFSFAPTAVVTNRQIDTLPTGAESIWSDRDLTESYETMTEAMSIMVYVLILAAAILAIVVLYNLGVLSFTERLRELATLKVMGFQSGKIRRLLLTQNIWLSITGVIFGIPCGKWLIDFMLSFMGDSFDMMCRLTVLNVVVSSVITCLLSIAVSFLFTGKIKRIDMVSSLKGVE